MKELGFLSDLGDEFGYLSCQALRSARILIDLGLHLGLKVPDGFWPLEKYGDISGEVWTPEIATCVLEELVLLDPVDAHDEVERYLGWPGQAISYKVGERVWLRARAEAQSRFGEEFSLKRFHAYALGLGSMGLDDFEAEMRRWDGK